MSSHTLSFAHGTELTSFQPNVTNFVIFALGAFFLYRVGLIIYRIWFHPLSIFPGPKLWAASTVPYIYKGHVKGTGIFDISKFHRKYGPVVRIGPNRLALDGSVGWPQVYARRTGGKPEFEKTPGIFAEGMEISLVAATHDTHRRQRRQLGHAFSDSAMYEQEQLISKYINVLVTRVQEHADAGKKMNIVQWLNFTTFDIIGDLTLGESFGCLEGSQYHPWVLNIFKGLRGDAFVWACSNYPIIGPLAVALFGGSAVKQGEMTRHLAMTKGGARIALGIEPKGRRDFMTYMLQPNRDGQPGLSPSEIIANSPLIILAGSETTASALSGFFFYVGQNSRVKEILQDEIRNAFEDESEIHMKSTAKLEYLHATLEETLRVYPPAAATPSRSSPGAEIDGKYVPEGTIVHVLQWATFRNPEHFADPDGFHPERWLRATHPRYDGARFGRDNTAVYKPFSHGPRDCIGKNLAYAEMRIIAARLLYRFDFDLLPGQEDWHNSQAAYIVWDKGPLEVVFTPRKTA